MTLVQRDAATVEECAAALRQLSDSDLRRLKEVARLRAMGLAALDWGDLLNEAIIRLLEGSRRWPKDVSLVVFLIHTMRSIVSDQWRRQEKRVVAANSETRVDAETCDGEVDRFPDVSMEPEARTTAAQALTRIGELFEHDVDALAVIAGMASGKSPTEILEENKMDRTRYATTQRRIRRGLVRTFPKGEESS